MAKGISIHIGLNHVDPKHYQGWDGALNACIADAKDMRALAKKKGFTGNTLLVDGQATAAAVSSALLDAGKNWLKGIFSSSPTRAMAAKSATPMAMRKTTTAWTRPGFFTTASWSTTSFTISGANSKPACASWCSPTAATAAR